MGGRRREQGLVMDCASNVEFGYALALTYTRHQLMVFHDRGVQRVLDKYVLRRWRKNVKRVHTKIRITCDNSSNTIEARRHENMHNLFNEVANLAEDCQEKYDKMEFYLPKRAGTSLTRNLFVEKEDCRLKESKVLLKKLEVEENADGLCLGHKRVL
ncbi:hypothetical protein RHGRI_022130 [Rhododendron griersonianum]|uniref:Protein FAR1-RELATED SEQUENCE n=1 Tax=Rhododendron griersonianum TaxID=479676 RepID=A0AAV6JP49_9ERIC|nr:hypothetical protein RHGRI_022130 [Rhododendron griersonianum]